MHKPKRKKIYYVPGIISLTLIPIAFCWFAEVEIRQSTIRTIPIVWADTAFMNKEDVVFSSFNGHFPPIRNYTDIVITGNQLDDETKLAFAQIRIREILNAGDSVNGLHFIFGDNAKYGSFVGAVDKLRVEGAKTYMPMDNHLWFYHFPPNPTVKLLEYDCLLCDDVIHFNQEISWWTHTKAITVNGWKSSWKIIVLYCSFVVCIIALSRKKNGS
jgi:hypothetical protein